MRPWIGVDLDGTLAEYHGWPADGGIGKPVPRMVERVKAWLAEGKDVKIVTARVSPLDFHCRRTDPAYQQAADQHARIRAWCVEHIGRPLPITATKDFDMVELWDDRAKQVLPNTGEALEELVRSAT